MGTRARAHPHVSLASGLVLVSSDVRVAGRLSKTNHITETTGKGHSRGAARVRPEREIRESDADGRGPTPSADGDAYRYTVNTALFTTTFDFIVKIPRRFMSLAGAASRCRRVPTRHATHTTHTEWACRAHGRATAKSQVRTSKYVRPQVTRHPHRGRNTRRVRSKSNDRGRSRGERESSPRRVLGSPSGVRQAGSHGSWSRAGLARPHALHRLTSGWGSSYASPGWSRSP